MGVKRYREGGPVDLDVTMADSPNNAQSNDDATATVISLFTTFRSELDEHHDRRERIIKASRDITAFSKKIVRTINKPVPKPIERELTERFSQINALFTSIAKEIFSGPNAWRYQWQYSPGLQEYIEALSFKHYIEHQRLITHEEVMQSLPDGIPVSHTDYLLGLFDLTGEMMRFAVTALTAKAITPAQSSSTSSDETKGHENGNDLNNNSNIAGGGAKHTLGLGEVIVTDLRDLRAMFERLNVRRNPGLSKEFNFKMDTMQASVEKVEKAAYGLLVRGKERPTGWIPDMTTAGPVETF